MEINHVLLVGCCFFVLLAIDCSSAADSRVIAIPHTDLDVKNPVTLNDKNNTNETTGGSVPVLDSMKGDKDQLNKSKEGVKNDLDKKSVSSDQLGSNDGHSVQKEKDNLKGKLPVKEGDKQEKPREESKPKEKPKGDNEERPLRKENSPKPKEKPKEGDNEERPLRKENSPPGEECDASNRCIDEENNLVACLRVPGNDSPDLSLLIQNKGKEPLTVRISAPDYVHLETRKFRLQQNEDKKVKVSIQHGGTDNLIILTAGKGRCSLDFRDVVMHDQGKETDTTVKSKYSILLNRTPVVAIVTFASFLIIASIVMCVGFKRRHFPSSESKYLKLDMELPVAGGVKPDSEVNDGWDDSWDDNWDDEEAPKTPSMPVTPSLSSKGLASRRSNKDGWKD